MQLTTGVRRALGCLLGFTLLACPDSPTEPAQPDLIGVVTSVYNAAGPVSVLVAAPSHPEGAGAVHLFIGTSYQNAMIVVERGDGSVRIGAPSDIVTGARIAAWTTGVERRSDPVQWDAVGIRVFRD